MYVCVCVHVLACVGECIYVCMHMWHRCMHEYMCAYACLCICMCVHIYACAHAGVSVCNVCLMKYPSEMGLREEQGALFFLQVCVFIDYVLGAKFSGYYVM